MSETKFSPINTSLEAGRLYCWCTCGLSKNEPFCDSSHRGKTDKKSLKFSIEKTGIKTLCACKKTKNPPYCDGSHTFY